MDILYTLIPLSVFLIFGILVVLAWAVNSGQFEDLDAEAERILLDDFAQPPGADTTSTSTQATAGTPPVTSTQATGPNA
ncbi:MAG: cbb3-type cytochrome oxidase assembly protein CcoS [Lautropia sp.]|nr:cbb3-type cytochrome oxidase assembly protein CcoS [Lautropia sp.]